MQHLDVISRSYIIVIITNQYSDNVAYEIVECRDSTNYVIKHTSLYIHVCTVSLKNC